MAGGLGLCGLDARRTALHGDEIRTCWIAAVPATAATDQAPVATQGADPRSGTPPDEPSIRRPRTFVPVEPTAAAGTHAATVVAVTAVATAAEPATRPGSPPSTTVAGSAPAHGWSLWGELET